MGLDRGWIAGDINTIVFSFTKKYTVYGTALHEKQKITK